MPHDLQPEWVSLGKLEFVERDCPVCKSKDGKPLYRKMWAGYEMHFWLCRSCDTLYARNPVAESSLARLFGSKNFFQGGEPGADNIDYFDFIGGEKYLRKTARGRISRIARYMPSGRMLEVASAAGFFLIEAKEAGYDIQGVEISAPMAKYASERWNVPVRGESIERIELPPDYFDVIASWGATTILRDPVGTMRKFHRALKPGGIWAFNTYYHDGLWHKLTRKNWNILVVQASQVYSTKGLLEIIRKEGFELLQRRRDWPHSDLLKIADHLGQNIGQRWLPKAIRITGLKDMIVQVPLPDVYEYL